MPKGRPKNSTKVSSVKVINPEILQVESVEPKVSVFAKKIDEINSQYIDSFYSYFIYNDNNQVPNFIIINGYKWDEEKQDKRPTLVKINYKMPALSNSNGTYNTVLSDSYTKDKLIKTTVRSLPEYESGIVQEWRIRDDGKLERIIANPDGSNLQIVEQYYEKAMKDHIKINKGAILNSMSDTEIEQLLAVRKSQGVHNQQGYQAKTPDNYDFSSF